jgi:hypothetical protein
MKYKAGRPAILPIRAFQQGLFPGLHGLQSLGRSRLDRGHQVDHFSEGTLLMPCLVSSTVREIVRPTRVIDSKPIALSHAHLSQFWSISSENGHTDQRTIACLMSRHNTTNGHGQSHWESVAAHSHPITIFFEVELVVFWKTGTLRSKCRKPETVLSGECC